ncbi:MAG: VCBS repeat-containing protein, partial [Planctomycetes bacterium]|nr:VCBS repeat-containing protein [Planctomycetota bacterium]
VFTDITEAAGVGGCGVHHRTGEPGCFQSTMASFGDLDGDGDLDLYLARSNGNNPDEIWFNNGSGTFTNSGQTLGNVQSNQVKLGDLDGDGDLDAVIAVQSSTVGNQIWLNDGSGTFTDSGQSLAVRSGALRFGIDLGDLDGDGDLDLFMTDYGSTDFVFVNDGAGVFSLHQT